MISVCVPTYNGEAYLAEALDSILAQTLPDFEVLVVDDGSSDGTVGIVEHFAARDPRVRVYRNERNLGLVGNWNRCVALARGEWIKFVFQDDVVAPTCLERLLAVGERGHLIVACARDFIFAPGTRESDVRDYRGHKALLDGLLAESVTAERFSELTLEHMDTNLLGEPTAVLLRRDVFDRFGPFNDRMVQVVDSEYWARVATAVGVGYVPDVLATFRVHSQSASTRNNGARQARTRLDGLVLRHEFAFSPVYAPLRAAGERVRPDLDLEREFWREAYWTLVVDRLAVAIARGDDRSRAEADQVFAAYPRLRNVPRSVAIRETIAGYLSRHELAARAYRVTKRVVAR